MIEFKPGDEAKAKDAIEHLANSGRQQAMYWLTGKGFEISEAAQALTASQLHGPIKGAPRVKRNDWEGDGTVYIRVQAFSEASHPEGAEEGAPGG